MIALLFLGLFAITASAFGTRLAQLMKMLDLKEESKVIFKDAMTIAIFGFILLSIAIPKVEYRAPSLSISAGY